MALSDSITASARRGSRFSRASNAWPSAFSTRPPIWATLRSKSSSSSWYERTMCSLIASDPRLGASSEATRNVIPCLPFLGIRKDLGRIALLYQLAEVEERRSLRNPRRLLHRVGYDHDTIIFAELID